MTTRILDGGMGRQLLRIGAPFGQPEWSALALIEAPERVAEAHRNFIAAGAEIITVNSYAVVPFHIGEERFAMRGRELVALAAGIARDCADAATTSVDVAASVPPLFGSYEPQNFRPDEAPALYDAIVEPQVSSVDLWIAETMSSIEEADAAVSAIERHRLPEQPIWLSFCLPDHFTDDGVCLRSGESVESFVATFAGRVDVISINCSQPERIEDALPVVVDALASVGRSLPIAAYANTFVPLDERKGANSAIASERTELTPANYADAAQRWLDLGASIVGGCCGIHPEHIAELAERHHEPALH